MDSFVFPAHTAVYAALLGILFIILSAWVSAGRGQYRVHHGDGGEEGLQRRIRAHANFAEYVPLALLLMGLAEATGTHFHTVHVLLIALLIARIVHPIGMVMPKGSLWQFLLRTPSILATWAVILIAAIMLLFDMQ